MKNIRFWLFAAAALSIAIAGPNMTLEPGIADSGDLGIATSAWFPAAGVPAQPGDPGDAGFVMQKDGPTASNAYPYAEITRAKGLPADSIVLGFDYKTGQNCTSRSPYFFLLDADGRHWIPCAAGTHQPDVPSPGWTRVTLTAQDATPPIRSGSDVGSLYLLFEDGTDTPDVETPGTVTLDNIRVNSTVITAGSAPKAVPEERRRSK